VPVLLFEPDHTIGLQNAVDGGETTCRRLPFQGWLPACTRPLRFGTVPFRPRGETCRPLLVVQPRRWR
jgi:hypothetical protein